MQDPGTMCRGKVRHVFPMLVWSSFETPASGGLLRMRSNHVAEDPHGEEAHRAVSNREARPRQ